MSKLFRFFSFANLLNILLIGYIAKIFVDFGRYELFEPTIIDTTAFHLKNILYNTTVGADSVNQIELNDVLIERTKHYGLFSVNKTQELIDDSQQHNKNLSVVRSFVVTDPFDLMSGVFSTTVSYYDENTTASSNNTEHVKKVNITEQILYKINLPINDYDFVKEITNNSTKVNIKFFDEPYKPWKSINLGTVLQYALIFLVFKAIMVGASSNSTTRLMESFDVNILTKKVKVHFSDVIGQTEAKEQLKLFVDIMKNRKKYEEIGAKIPRGVLLSGPPGCGKTLLAKAVAGESEVSFLSVCGSDFDEALVGIGSSRVKKLFDLARETQPCIIFIDEIDSVGEKRDSKLFHEPKTLNSILSEMDGMKDRDSIMVIASTNRETVLDKALIRSGRFDSKIYVDFPKKLDRVELFKLYLSKIKLDSSIKIDEVSEILSCNSPYMTGADIANVCNQASLTAVKKGETSVKESYLKDAVDDVMFGIEKTSKKHSGEELMHTAYHEAGHALINFIIKGANNPLKVSIVPRGHGIAGYTKIKESDSSNKSREEMIANVYGLLAGRGAEIVKFNKVCSGASSDFEKATAYLQLMITREGMFAPFAPMTYDLDRTSSSCVSDAKRFEIESMIQTELKTIFNSVLSLLEKHIDQLDTLANKLLEDEIVDQEYIKNAFGHLEDSVVVKIN